MKKTILIGISILTLFFPFIQKGVATEICSRTAIVNFQELLVDTSANSKGDGLRYYLEKDPVAKEHFDTYQNGARPKWMAATIGTLGSSMLLVGLFTPKTSSENRKNRERFMLGGVAALAINYLIAKTMDYNNERHLENAVQEYNKRNLPKIYFDPFQSPGDHDRTDANSMGISTGILQEF